MNCGRQAAGLGLIDTDIASHILAADIREIAQSPKPQTDKFVVDRVQFAEGGNVNGATEE